jgi:hypothetical protein
MTKINRLLILVAAVVGFTAGAAQAAGGTRNSSIAEGKVTSVSASHMTIASDAGKVTFAITGDTDILARGAKKATKAAGKGTRLTHFVRSGDLVTVTYKKAAGAITASVIRVGAAAVEPWNSGKE